MKLVVGTDRVNVASPFDDPRLRRGAFTLHEMELLYRAGLSAPTILAAATRSAAEALKIIDKLGTITEGKLADLAILDGDLLQDCPFVAVAHSSTGVWSTRTRISALMVTRLDPMYVVTLREAVGERKDLRAPATDGVGPQPAPEQEDAQRTE